MADAYRYNMGKAEGAFQKMQNNGIKGSKLYMLWNDCCDRDAEMAIEAILTKSVEEILEHINYEGGRGIPFTREEIFGV